MPIHLQAEEQRPPPTVAEALLGPAAQRTRAISIETVAFQYGLELHRSGRVWMALCPFHDDHEPSLLLDPSDNHFHCFSAACTTRHGNLVDLVRHIEGIGHAEAIARLKRLAADPPRAHPVCEPNVARAPAAPSAATPTRRTRRRKGRRTAAESGPEARACLTAAVELYANCLLGDATAREYVERRGLRRDTVEQCRVGFARGGELTPYLRWRGLSTSAARQAGLIRADGTETLAGRIVVPELRGGACLWMVGRTLGAGPHVPKYLGLAGDKPLLGWDWACSAAGPVASAPAGVVIVEGPFDLLTLVQWAIPAVALVGTHVRTESLRALDRFERLYVLLDDDEAGRAAAARLCSALAPRALSVVLGDYRGAKDASDLAPRAEGRSVLRRALERACETTSTLMAGTTDLDAAA